MKRVVLSGVAGAGVLLAILALVVAPGLPPRGEVRALAEKNPGTTALMDQRAEEARRRGQRWHRVQTWVPLSRVSRNLIQAVVASEDQRFFEHGGIDWVAVRESLAHDVEAGRVARGGSTITQQLAKNLFFGTRKTLVRKARELVVAHWLEEDLTKPRILEIYLNVIEWGDGTWGCEAAAHHWYGVEASALGRQEAAGLAAMIPNPRRINPRVSPRGHERLTRRVLWLMDLGRSVAHDVAGLGSEPPPEAPLEGERARAADEYAVPPELETDLDLGEDEGEEPEAPSAEDVRAPEPEGGAAPTPPLVSPPPAPSTDPQSPPAEEPHGGHDPEAPAPGDAPPSA